jgi:hypothetical protein
MDHPAFPTSRGTVCGRGRPLSDGPSSRLPAGSTLGGEEASAGPSPRTTWRGMNSDDLSELKTLRKRVLDLRGFL